ncbi:uncharacterized protein LOC142234093 isoform X2 [Haematobia irritans]|uniref:uncharacterized protein LOC142234093 isoform X2 n=1 Tax=Haematobia irritans TaxID=7368 RepID=UPI003F5012F2
MQSKFHILPIVLKYLQQSRGRIVPLPRPMTRRASNGIHKVPNETNYNLKSIYITRGKPIYKLNENTAYIKILNRPFSSKDSSSNDNKDKSNTVIDNSSETTSDKEPTKYDDSNNMEPSSTHPEGIVLKKVFKKRTRDQSREALHDPMIKSSRRRGGERRIMAIPTVESIEDKLNSAFSVHIEYMEKQSMKDIKLLKNSQNPPPPSLENNESSKIDATKTIFNTELDDKSSKIKNNNDKNQGYIEDRKSNPNLHRTDKQPKDLSLAFGVQPIENTSKLLVKDKATEKSQLNINIPKTGSHVQTDKETLLNPSGNKGPSKNNSNNYENVNEHILQSFHNTANINNRNENVASTSKSNHKKNNTQIRVISNKINTKSQNTNLFTKDPQTNIKLGIKTVSKIDTKSGTDRNCFSVSTPLGRKLSNNNMEEFKKSSENLKKCPKNMFGECITVEQLKMNQDKLKIFQKYQHKTGGDKSALNSSEKLIKPINGIRGDNMENTNWFAKDTEDSENNYWQTVNISMIYMTLTLIIFGIYEIIPSNSWEIIMKSLKPRQKKTKFTIHPATYANQSNLKNHLENEKMSDVDANNSFATKEISYDTTLQCSFIKDIEEI